MKKYVFLTSALVLTACGGGSGGGGGGGVIAPATLTRASDAAVQDNKNVTSVATEVLVADDTSLPSIVRSARVTHEGKAYTAYHLDDVTFTMAAASAGGGDEAGNKDTLKFKLDNEGRIIAVDHSALVYKNGKYVKNAAESATFKRNSKTDISLTVNQVNGEGKHYTGKGTFETLGDGLRYSDFGWLNYDLHYTKGDESGDEKSYEPFAGGYDVLRHKKPETDMEFAGRAVGSVSVNDDNRPLDGAATLVFAEGKETLDMKFSESTNPWYDVKIVRDGNSNSIAFTDQGNVTSHKFNDADFTDGVKTKENYLVDGYNGAKYPVQNKNGIGKLDIGYYGIDGKVTEATGVTQYVDQTESGEIRMNVGFGMKQK